MYTTSVNGEITRNNCYTGTYTVNKDCTSTLTLNTAEHFDQFIAPNDSEFTFISTDSGFAISAFEERATARRAGD